MPRGMHNQGHHVDLRSSRKLQQRLRGRQDGTQILQFRDPKSVEEFAQS
jgi:hypothetical protein